MMSVLAFRKIVLEYTLRAAKDMKTGSDPTSLPVFYISFCLPN